MISTNLASTDGRSGGMPDASINAEGMAAVQKIRADRMSPGRRRGELRVRMLTWLADQDHQGGPADWSGFASGPDIAYYCNDFTEKDIHREADYLQEKGLIRSHKVWNAAPGTVRPTITTDGQDCLVDFGGNVSEYLSRGQRPNQTTNTTNNVAMTGSTGKITVASDNVVQNVNSGLDTTKLLDFAGFVRQSIPVIGVDGEEQEALGTQSEELHREASSASPDKGRLRSLTDSILEGLRLAAPTVVQSTAIGLGGWCFGVE